MTLFDRIIQAVSPYDAETSVCGNTLTVANRQNGKTLKVYAEPYAEYIVEFTTQHRHFEAEDADEIEEYVTAVLNDEVLPLEFYAGGQRRFGGEISRADHLRYSLTELLRRRGYDIRALSAFEYELSSWSGAFDTGRRKIDG